MKRRTLKTLNQHLSPIRMLKTEPSTEALDHVSPISEIRNINFSHQSRNYYLSKRKQSAVTHRESSATSRKNSINIKITGLIQNNYLNRPMPTQRPIIRERLRLNTHGDNI